MVDRFMLQLIIIVFVCIPSVQAFGEERKPKDTKMTLDGSLLANAINRIPLKGFLSEKHCEKASKPMMQKCVQNILDDKKDLERSVERVQNKLNFENACQSSRSVEEFKEEVRRKLIPNYTVDSNDKLGLSYADVIKQITQIENYFAGLCDRHK